MGHNTTLFFAHGHSTQICCRGYTHDTNEAVQKWYAYERKSRDLGEINKINTTKSLPLRVQNNAEKVNIPLDSCTNPSVTASGWSTCQLHNCSTLANFISRLIPKTELLVPDM